MTYDVDKNYEEVEKYSDSEWYGQWETDRIIHEYVGDVENGWAIEVGAADGVRGSNTKWFEERGWNVLCIEPNPLFQSDLLTNRQHILEVAVGQVNTTMAFSIFNVGRDNIMSSLSSLRPDPRLVNDHEHIINSSYSVDVPVRTLTKIIEEEAEPPFLGRKQYDFISIDTEGTEMDVLEGIDFDTFDVKLYVVENNYKDNVIPDFMWSRGYRMDQRYKINEFYVRA